MQLQIFWSKRASDDFDETLSYLYDNWGEKSTLKFIDKIDELIHYISQNPFIYPLVKDNIRKCVVNKYTTLYYRVKDDTVEIITLFGNRQNPDKKKLK